jgi:hypothetical protein
MKRSSKLTELWFNENRTLSISEYEKFLDERLASYNKKMIINYIIMIVFFCIGLWAFIDDAILITIIMLALAAHFMFISFWYSDKSENIDMYRLLAMLINKEK